MPIYEYQCGKCGVFEETQRITEPALERCPTCRRKVRRLISNTSFQLKGGGWYVTDYGRGGQKGKDPGGAEPSKSSSDGASSDSSSTGTASTASPDAKPAKSETKSAAKPKAESKPATAGA